MVPGQVAATSAPLWAYLGLVGVARRVGVDDPDHAASGLGGHHGGEVGPGRLLQVATMSASLEPEEEPLGSAGTVTGRGGTDVCDGIAGKTEGVDGRPQAYGLGLRGVHSVESGGLTMARRGSTRRRWAVESDQ